MSASVTTDSARDVSGPVTHGRTCDGCREAFTPTRADARYCSPACRQRAYRDRREAGRPKRRRRPITDEWRDAARDLRRAAERLDRLAKDDRFAANLATIHAISGMDLRIAAGVVGGYAAWIDALPRKARMVPYAGSSAVTTGCAGDGSGWSA